MNAALEFHDSEVSSVVADAGQASIRFSAAYVHRSVGIPGVDSGAGYTQAIEISLYQPIWVGPLPECIGKLSDGQIEVNGQTLSLVPVPYTAEGQISLTMTFANGSEFSSSAKGIEVKQAGAPRYVEAFSC